jgi:hypothetical protein
MRTGHDVDLTPSQARSLEVLRARIEKTYPKAEIKEWNCHQLDHAEVRGYENNIVVLCTVGFREENDWNYIFRQKLIYLIAPKGGINQFTVKDIFIGPSTRGGEDED